MSSLQHMTYVLKTYHFYVFLFYSYFVQFFCWFFPESYSMTLLRTPLLQVLTVYLKFPSIIIIK